MWDFMEKLYKKWHFGCLAMLAFISFGSSPTVFAGDKFITGFSDLPIMPGMRELPDADVSFDTTSGRIVIAFVKTDRKVNAVMVFYDRVLRQLGWEKKSSRTFMRDEEILTFDFVNDGDSLIVRFSIEPVKA
jgi:hypothetical protein